MARRKSSTFTEVELEFMNIIWEHGEVSTEDIQKSLEENDRYLTDGSIRKILSILMTKGHLERRKMGRRFYYKAKVEETLAHKNIIQDILKRAFAGSAPLMVAALLGSRGVKKGDIEEIKRLIAEYERGKSNE